MSDLRFAEEVLVNGGVVFVDDVFNPEWPGVVEGVPAFLRAVPALVPFAFVGGQAASHHGLAQTSRAPALHHKHMQHLPACRGAGMCFGDKPWWGHEVHTRKAKSTMVRKQEEMELPANHKSRRAAAHASA